MVLLGDQEIKRGQNWNLSPNLLHPIKFGLNARNHSSDFCKRHSFLKQSWCTWIFWAFCRSEQHTSPGQCDQHWLQTGEQANASSNPQATLPRSGRFLSFHHFSRFSNRETTAAVFVSYENTKKCSSMVLEVRMHPSTWILLWDVERAVLLDTVVMKVSFSNFLHTTFCHGFREHIIHQSFFSALHRTSWFRRRRIRRWLAQFRINSVPIVIFCRIMWN